MKKINYSYEHGSSSRVLKHYKKHLSKIGDVVKIQGIRYKSLRKNSYVITCEKVRIYGKNGKCLFDGVCWGYSGEGPRALVAILTSCGLDKKVAENVAFSSPRNNSIGIDWQIDVSASNTSVKFNFENSKTTKPVIQKQLF